MNNRARMGIERQEKTESLEMKDDQRRKLYF